jgi:hypothetical protein
MRRIAAALFATVLAASAAHAGKVKTTSNKGLTASVSDTVHRPVGPQEAAMSRSISSSWEIELPAQHPLAKKDKLKMLVQMPTEMTSFGNEGGVPQTVNAQGPTGKSWVELTKDPKTGKFVGKGSMNLVYNENFSKITPVRRDVAVTDGSNGPDSWYSDFGKGIVVATPPVMK